MGWREVRELSQCVVVTISSRGGQARRAPGVAPDVQHAALTLADLVVAVAAPEADADGRAQCTVQGRTQHAERNLVSAEVVGPRTRTGEPDFNRKHDSGTIQL